MVELTTDERIVLTYAGCYADVEDPYVFDGACTGYAPVKLLEFKDGSARAIMNSLLSKGMVRTRLEYDDVPEEEWGDYRRDDFVFDWTPEGREVVKGNWGIYWFFWKPMENVRFYPEFRSADGNIDAYMKLLNDRIDNAGPYDDVYYEMQSINALTHSYKVCRNTFERFVKRKHAPGRQEHRLYVRE